MAEKVQNSLMPLDDKKALTAFKTEGGLEPLLAALEKECRAVAIVLNTENGRNNISKRARDVASVKIKIDEIGKALNKEHQQEIDLVNVQRNAAWKRLEDLQKEIKKPLDDWEAGEKLRIKGHEDALAAIKALAVFPEDQPAPSSTEIKSRIDALKNEAPRKWAEYDTRAARFIAETMADLHAFLEGAEEREHEERLTIEWHGLHDKAERENRDFDVASAAAKAARDLAESKAKKEAAEVEAQNQINLVWEQAHRDNAEFDQVLAEKRADQQEADKWQAIFNAADSENNAFDIAKNATAFAQAEADRAAQTERDNQARENKRLQDEADAREADQANRQAKHGEVIDAIADILESAAGNTREEMAFDILMAISRGEIPHVKITY